MNFWDRFERRFGWLAVPHVAASLIFAQLTVYVMVLLGKVDFNMLSFNPVAIIQGGEFWRVFSFVIAPTFLPSTLIQGLFLAIGMYLFYMMSETLEAEWGTFKFNIYLIAAVLFSLIGGFVGYFISPKAFIEIGPGFLYVSVFFAFATLCPNYEFLLFFVLPVKVKWLAWIAAVFVAAEILFAASIGNALAAIAPVLNYLWFFGPRLKQSVSQRGRRRQFTAESKALASEAFHTCSVCGATDKSHPEVQFRYKQESGEAICICESCRET